MSTKVQRLEAFMHARIRLFLANGGKLKRDEFVSYDGCRCAVAACVPVKHAGQKWRHALSSIFGEEIELHEFDGLTTGFDGDAMGGNEFYDLGRRLADEYLTAVPATTTVES